MTTKRWRLAGGGWRSLTAIIAAVLAFGVADAQPPANNPAFWDWTWDAGMPKLTYSFTTGMNPERKKYKVEAAGKLRVNDTASMRIKEARFRITSGFMNGTDPVTYGDPWYFAGSRGAGLDIVGSPAAKLFPISLVQPADPLKNAVSEGTETGVEVCLQVKMEIFSTTLNAWQPFLGGDWININPTKFLVAPAAPPPDGVPGPN